ncbi:MAG: hypothetical protein Q8J85_07095 [Sulfuricurvum sp.]|nr:hypothetical protein [Sulfuricurvum sp.]MDP3023008.1 hypothetical protein [Sulfuricurvum sp.]
MITIETLFLMNTVLTLILLGKTLRNEYRIEVMIEQLKITEPV